MSNLPDTHLFIGNAVFIEELYQRYLSDPQSVDIQWQSYFKSLDENPQDVRRAFHAASWHPNTNRLVGYASKEEKAAKVKEKSTEATSPALLHRSLAAMQLVDAYRNYGHIEIQYDPLGLNKPQYFSSLHPENYNLSDADLDQEAQLDGALGMERATLRQVIGTLQQTYASRIGFEFMHIESEQERTWIQSKIEDAGGNFELTPEEKKQALFDLIEVESFESFAHTKFPGTKRFSAEGGEASLLAVEAVIRHAVQHDVREVILGMAHRGRLNTLTKVMRKPYHAMFSEFKGELAFPDNMGMPGDVKYHLGISSDVEVEGHKVHLSLTPNPSHLEVVNSVVLGKVRAKQDRRHDIDRKQVLALLIHGDAAFAGQGTVAESLYLSGLKGYHVGGTIHVVVNNQIGFTTDVVDARSSRYCTDVAKAISAPVLHVSGEDIDAVIFASRLAAEYRAIFKKDIVLDVVCYRKYGHNEGDEPMFTQPLMYQSITQHLTPDYVYAQKLIAAGVIVEEDYNAYKAKFKEHLEKEFQIAQSYKPQQADWLSGNWSSMRDARNEKSNAVTGVPLETLRKIGRKLCETPPSFNINMKIAKQLQGKLETIETRQNLEWGTGEALAYGSLLLEGYAVRMTGQDCERGTFSHRHAVLCDQKTEDKHIPLNNLDPAQKAFLEIHNSNLSEFAVMSFEYGYSIADPNTLTIWEAQFGDFANGAQVVIDQYISSGEAKWLRMSGLVLLLPHGYEGNGPEHSSARPERFLQLCADDNMQVVNCSTPASFFHVLRRQLHRNFRKPLIVMTPKSLLRHKLAVSKLEDMAEGTSFLPVIREQDAGIKPAKVGRVVLCSGRVYYDLFEARGARQDVAILRLEQLYPFPAAELQAELAKYKEAEIVWCQEEHENMGAYHFVERHIVKLLRQMNYGNTEVRYAGRAESASPAVGYMKLHTIELQKFLEEALGK